MTTSKNADQIIKKLSSGLNHLENIEMDLIFNYSKYRKSGLTIPDNVMIESKIEYLEMVIKHIKRSIKDINSI